MKNLLAAIGILFATSAIASPRTILTNNITIYVNPMSPVSTSTVQTFAQAVAIIQNTLDFNGFNVTIQLANTTYTYPLEFGGEWVGNGNVIIDLGGATVNVNDDDCITIAIPTKANFNFGSIDSKWNTDGLWS
jgi:hypothetical protein